MKPITKLKGSGVLNQHVRIDAELVEQMARMNVSIHPSMTYTLNDLLDAVYTMANRKENDPAIAIYTNCGLVMAINSNMKSLKVNIVDNNQVDSKASNNSLKEWDRLTEQLIYENY